MNSRKNPKAGGNNDLPGLWNDDDAQCLHQLEVGDRSAVPLVRVHGIQAGANDLREIGGGDHADADGGNRKQRGIEAGDLCGIKGEEQRHQERNTAEQFHEQDCDNPQGCRSRTAHAPDHSKPEADDKADAAAQRRQQQRR